MVQAELRSTLSKRCLYAAGILTLFLLASGAIPQAARGQSLMTQRGSVRRQATSNQASVLLGGTHRGGPPSQSGLSAKSGPVASGHAIEAYGKLPLSFEVNEGQSDRQVGFLARGSGYMLFLTGDEAVLSLRTARQKSKGKGQATVLRMRLVGANPHASVTGLDELPGKSNYFLGNDPKRWRTNVPHYARVRYESIYPSVDLVYYGSQR